MTLQDKIYKLFLLEGQVRGLSRRLEVATYQQTVLEKKLGQLQTQHSELNEQLKHTQVTSLNLEHQARDIGERITTLRNQMNTVTNNKEYSALLVEVNTIKLEKSNVEDEALAEMGRLEELQKQSDELKEQVEQQKKMAVAAAAEVGKRQEEVGAELAERITKRDEAAEDIPVDARAIFIRLSEQHDGEALASIVEENARRMEYSCGGCYMALPLECVNSVVMRKDSVTTCPSCSRMLYMAAELEEAMSSRSTKSKS